MDAYTGEIRAFGFYYPPVNWKLCNGQLLYVQQYPALFSILGARFGGNAQTTFGLPNLQAVVPVSSGSVIAGSYSLTFTFANQIGEDTHTLTYNEMANHKHIFNGATPGTGTTAAGSLENVPTNTSYISNIFALAVGSTTTGQLGRAYGPATASPLALMNVNAISIAGGDPTNHVAQAHNNMMPYQVINFCICVEGDYPVNPN